MTKLTNIQLVPGTEKTKAIVVPLIEVSCYFCGHTHTHLNAEGPLGLPKRLNPIQQRILDIEGIIRTEHLGYRRIGALIGVSHPQKVKHHIIALQKKGLLNLSD